MAIYTRAELEKQKESLTARLKEVTEHLNKLDEIVYKGKEEEYDDYLEDCGYEMAESEDEEDD